MPRFDRRIVQAPPTEDARTWQIRVNEALRQLSEQVLKLEGRGGDVTVNAPMTVKSEEYTLMDFESSIGGRASISAAKGTTRGFCLAKGARRGKDGQWIATDVGAVILELLEDGTMTMYADTGLTIGAAYAPTVAITFPTSSSLSPHGITSTYHTATGLTPGNVLTASATNAFGWSAPAATITTHEVTGTYHSVTGLTTGDVLTASGTNSFGWATPAAGLSAHAIVGTYHTATGLTTGDVLTATATDSFSFVSPGATSVAAPPGWIFQGTTVAVTNTTLSNTNLTMALVAGGYYRVQLRVYGYTYSTPDVKYQLTFSGTTTYCVRHVRKQTGNNVNAVGSTYPNAFDSTDQAITGSEGVWYIWEEIDLLVGDAGTMLFKFAQNTASSGNPTTLFGGSYIMWKRYA